MRVLITCPPMLKLIDQLAYRFEAKDVEFYCPDVVQIMSEDELIELLPEFDAWIIGDDPATKQVFEAGCKGKLKAALKWGVGVDNVDFEAAKALGIPITNTPNMFGREVADLAMSYVTGLARLSFTINQGVKQGAWPKPAGVSLADKHVALVGLGDIGQNVAKRLLAADMKVCAYDPFAYDVEGVERKTWPEGIENADFVVLTCALNDATHHMVNAKTISDMKAGVRIVNVARGPLIDEAALIEGLASGHVLSAALDVFEVEPLPDNSALRNFDNCIFGSHNGSNTVDAVLKTSELAITKIFDFLDVS